MSAIVGGSVFKVNKYLQAWTHTHTHTATHTHTDTHTHTHTQLQLHVHSQWVNSPIVASILLLQGIL